MLQGNGPQAKAIARNLDDKLAALKVKIQDALVNQVSHVCLKAYSGGIHTVAMVGVNKKQ